MRCRIGNFTCLVLLVISANIQISSSDEDYAAQGRHEDDDDITIFQMEVIVTSLNKLMEEVKKLSNKKSGFSADDFALALSSISSDLELILGKFQSGIECKADIEGLNKKTVAVEHSILEKLATAENRIMDLIGDLKTSFENSLGKFNEQFKKKDRNCMNKSGQQLNTTALSNIPYLYGVSKQMDWSWAFEYCRFRGMELLSVDSEEELEDVWMASPNRGIEYWTSGTDKGRKNGRFYWAHSGKSLNVPLDPDSERHNKPKNETCINIAFGKLAEAPCLREVPGVICKTPDHCL